MILALLALQASVTLKLDMKPGKSVAYDVVRDYRDPEAGDRNAYFETLTLTVAPGHEAGKYAVKTETRLLKIIVDTQEFVQTDTEQVTQLNQVWSGLGQVLDREPYPHLPQLRARQENPLFILRSSDPLTVGFEWGQDQAADATLDIPAASWKWTVSSVNESQVVVSLDYKEVNTNRAITAEGSIALNRKDGWIDSSDVTLHNTIVPGDELLAKVDLHVTWKRRA
ncbi:MAG: hypothetical protein JSS66_16245 [Armatimonadetes bacterium]|nr:hypothetical protein [Armatimonadota bacterium]